MLTAVPYGAHPNDTAEFMLGDVHVTTVLLESSTNLSSSNNNSENWRPSTINATKEKITDGLQWWTDTLGTITDKHELNFDIDFTHADTPFVVDYEPITGQSTGYRVWVADFLEAQGFKSGSLSRDIRAFNHTQRLVNNTNWAFTIFVVNDENDRDHQFAAGGLSRAFAFAGGQFMVTLASRPASTTTHEVGHIFWALDEYQGAGSYDRFRGYYDTQNTNAWNNPVFSQGQQREPSIMDRGACSEGGGLLCTAFQQHTSSRASLEMIGWRDSDEDGIFDVLDVPLTLSGSGYYDALQGEYLFTGHSSVQTLPNMNPPQPSGSSAESLRNDITINNVSRAQYRIDNGNWQTIAAYHDYHADLNLRIPVTAGTTRLELRTIDDKTGITSPIFEADLTRPTSVQQPGINGFVFDDADSDGEFDPGENGLAGHTVQLVDGQGQALTLSTIVEPDGFGANEQITQTTSGVTLRPIGTAFDIDAVYSRSSAATSTGTRSFGVCTFESGGACAIYASEWTGASRAMRIDFAEPVTSVAIDAISNGAAEYGRLEVFDSNGQLLDRFTTAPLANGQIETMHVGRSTADIAYAIAGGHAGTAVGLDNLRVGPASATVTDETGAFLLPHLVAGQYNVEVMPPAGAAATTAGVQQVTLATGAAAGTFDFGFAAPSAVWQNDVEPADVSGDGVVSPLDALLIVNDLNANGSRTLPAIGNPPPYLDVNGDGLVTPLDVLVVVNHINEPASEAEATSLVSPAAAMILGAPEAEASREPMQRLSELVERPGIQSVEPFGDDFVAIPPQDQGSRSANASAVASIDELYAALSEGGELGDIVEEIAADVDLAWT